MHIHSRRRAHFQGKSWALLFYVNGYGSIQRKSFIQRKQFKEGLSAYRALFVCISDCLGTLHTAIGVPAWDEAYPGLDRFSTNHTFTPVAGHISRVNLGHSCFM